MWMCREGVVKLAIYVIPRAITMLRSIPFPRGLEFRFASHWQQFVCFRLFLQPFGKDREGWARDFIVK
jgi:hypothetical protein